jgi:nucleotide-binding universal stress UspA family protein
MRIGRPVLLVPGTLSTCTFDRLLVAWKDTREAQRAIADALPFLRMARTVAIVEIAGEAERTESQVRLAEVTAWLARHGVKVEPKVVAPSGATSAQLQAIADAMDADLIVAGAYGYSRHNAWVLGGLTSSLLAGSRRCALLVH